ncbi:Hexosyltransferase [Plasmodiophora brassicae]|uniref:Hexosyltransferase n=1 Tax=Plasmodiophora brassicae TaxID=37360 RepID=A0A0G4IMU9_PLABS|nr:hypothetical protein PBRA_005131 [Plasmodiophora brassicae]SPQ94579.1 unnamed protein product [Plasmodiophora brassicae]
MSWDRRQRWSGLLVTIGACVAVLIIVQVWIGIVHDLVLRSPIRLGQFAESTVGQAPPEGDAPETPHIYRSSYRTAKKVVAFSVFGNRTIDADGAVWNARSMPFAYAGWKVRFYVDSTVPVGTLDRIRTTGAEIRRVPPQMETWREARRMFRFMALVDDDVDYVMFRDTDSYVSMREITAANEWLMTNRTFHVMRDHQFHTTHILAGMWGAYAPVLRQRMQPSTVYDSMRDYVTPMIDGYMKRDVDQDYLSEFVWKHAVGDVVEHDAFNCPGSQPYVDQPRPFPLPRDESADFVGNIRRLDFSATSNYVIHGGWQFRNRTPVACRRDPQYIWG